MFLLAITLFMVSLSSCVFDDDDGSIFNCVNGQGQVISQQLNVAPFTGIAIEGSMDVFITGGAEQNVVVEAQENIIPEIDLDVENGVWEIDFEDCVRDLKDVKIFITIPELNYIRISGSGDVISENILATETMVLRISGSGDMDLGLDVVNLDAEISGSGDMTFEGLADNFVMQIRGSGDFNAFSLDAINGEVEISGSGNARVRVSEILQVKISGSGNVFYKGNPIIDAQITGSGDVINAN